MAYEPIPLASRFDGLDSKSNSIQNVNRWTLSGPGGVEVELGLPAYSRMLRHLEFEDGISDHLVANFTNYGIPWLGPSRANWAAFPLRVAAIYSDAPVEVSQLSGAAAIQFQFFGRSRSNHLPSAYSYWKPEGHTEISSPEHMAKKVAAVREMMPERIPVGAALIAMNSTVYEDVRLLIDCGFDFIELITGSTTQLKPNGWIEFESDVATCVNLAVKARRDSRCQTKLWINAPITQAQEWLTMLRAGVDACCIDPFITSRRPAEQPTSTSFAGIKVSTQSKFEWIVGVLREFQNSFLDIHNFYSN